MDTAAEKGIRRGADKVSSRMLGITFNKLVADFASATIIFGSCAAFQELCLIAVWARVQHSTHGCRCEADCIYCVLAGTAACIGRRGDDATGRSEEWRPAL